MYSPAFHLFLLLFFCCYLLSTPKLIKKADELGLYFKKRVGLKGGMRWKMSRKYWLMLDDSGSESNVISLCPERIFHLQLRGPDPSALSVTELINLRYVCTFNLDSAALNETLCGRSVSQRLRTCASGRLMKTRMHKRGVIELWHSQTERHLL